MNTVSKGDRFEEICYSVINKALHDKQLGLIPEQCKVLKKAKYYSQLRESDITFDIAIEVWPNGATQYSQLWLIECKDYSGTVDVGEVETFCAHASQMKAHNVKAVFISRNQISSTAIKYLKSNGCMFFSANYDEQYKIEFHKTTKEYSRYDLKNNSDKASIFIDGLVKSFKHLFNLNENSQKSNVQHLSSNDIEELANKIINDHNEIALANNLRVYFSALNSDLSQKYGLRFLSTDEQIYDTSGRQVLSYCSHAKNCIWIHNSLIDTAQYNFIIAHEIGHYFLHENVSLNQGYYESLEDSKYDLRKKKNTLSSDRNWIEWQANTFASYLLMPRNTFLKRLYIAKRNVGYPTEKVLYIDDQRSNIVNFSLIQNELARYFGTTKAVVTYRLISLNLVKFNSRTRRVDDLINEYLEW